MALLLSLAGIPVSAPADTFVGHCRQRLPLMAPEGRGCNGPVPEMIERALRYAGHTVTWHPYPWARSLHMARHGGLDILPMHSLDAKRRTFLLPILYGHRVRTIAYFAHVGSDVEVDAFDDLRRYRVGALRDSFYSNEFNNAVGLDVFHATHNDQLRTMLAYDRLDVAVTSNIHEIEQFRQDKNLRQLAYVEYFVNDRYFSIPKHSEKAVYYDQIVHQIDLMRGRGEIDAIFRNYGVVPPRQDVGPHPTLIRDSDKPSASPGPGKSSQ
ncbi:ABC transporter substrate-binding protein [Marinobacter nanhaiticus D15-8W]|uniref:ABC transporter substrate-binding protein n=2 Tax=Marinobacter TaxID=2742 RepID=N6VYB1_9GAMM|nr:ABC transporter substrate-binding protein [Marinobacter nanhaiticus D15-8W]